MAFCNTCGTSLTPESRFCNKCGAPILASSVPTTGGTASPVNPASPSVAGAPQGSGALKTVLIVVGAVFFLGLLGIASLGFFAWRMAHNTRIHQDRNNVRVETPFGNVETTKDPAEAARNLGVDLYPGAEVLKDGAASASFGTMHTVTLNSQTADSVEKVATFYKAKFPNAMVTSSDTGRCTIISNDHRNVVTINIEAEDGRTKILITNVTRKADASNSSSN